MDREPFVVEARPEWVVVAKPGGLHTAPLAAGEEDTLLGWVIARYPEVAGIPGRKSVEPGLLHRLDRETSGLVLIARTASAFEFLEREGEAGRFRKRYVAHCGESSDQWSEWPFAGSLAPRFGPARGGTVIRTAFRAYGPGRRRVAPVLSDRDASGRSDGSGELRESSTLYETRIVTIEPNGTAGASGSRFVVRVELTRGFRHQIRCHLAAMGLPIEADELYAPPQTLSSGGRLRLHAERLEFTDPATGTLVVVECPEIKYPEP